MFVVNTMLVVLSADMFLKVIAHRLRELDLLGHYPRPGMHHRNLTQIDCIGPFPLWVRLFF